MYIFDHIEQPLKEKTKDFENRFEHPLISQMEYSNNYEGKLIDRSKVVLNLEKAPK